MDWNSVIISYYGWLWAKRRQAEERSAEIANQLKLKKAAISSIKTITITRYLSPHEFQIKDPHWSLW